MHLLDEFFLRYIISPLNITLTSLAIASVLVAALHWYLRRDPAPALYAVVLVPAAILMHSHARDVENRIAQHVERSDGRIARMQSRMEGDTQWHEFMAEMQAETDRRARREWPVIGLFFQAWDVVTE